MRAPGTSSMMAAGQRLVGIDRTKVLNAVEVTGLAGNLNDPLHGATDDDDLATGSARRQGGGADAADIGREGGDGDASGRARDQPGERLGDVALGRRPPVADGVGG